MRDQIIGSEISQFKKCLKKLYNSAGHQPAITLVVVNKRINQRMFITDGAQQNSYLNPPPGSIIDSKLVENQDDQSCFDFFLVPQQTTQGCVTPTHFFVSLNESKELSKEDIETFTYGLCFTYSNWSGSIKVPSPCQHAHKLAEYHFNFDKSGSIKNGRKVTPKDVNFNAHFRGFNYYL
mmetsp:Transcript_7624/g.12823  ORF Transcript_7624/g.12823 Transcript_7624/m.12823 type:complete len:179 (+) Transcript_7624:829-1365(+)